MGKRIVTKTAAEAKMEREREKLDINACVPHSGHISLISNFSLSLSIFASAAVFVTILFPILLFSFYI